jgi:Bacterial membrane protein YfhO
VVAGRDTGLDALGTAARVAWGFASAQPHGPAAIVRLASLLEWLVLGAAALALIVLRVRGRVGAPAFVALAALLVAVDLFKAGFDYNPAIPLEHALQPTTPAIRFLQSQSPARFAALDVRTPLSLAYPLPPNVAMRHGVQDVRGYVIPTEERYFELWRQVIAPTRDCYYLFCTQAAPARPRALNALGLLGVSHLLQHHEDPPLPKLRSAYAGRDARIYANPGALPRAFVVYQQTVASGANAALAAVTSPGFPARAVAVTERRISGLAEGTGTPTGRPGRARVAAYEPERVIVDARATRPALLVLTDTWFPGWKATVDGEPAPIHRVDYVIRGVSVPAGAHRVEFRYDPASWRFGWIISAVALLGIAGAAAIGWRLRPGSG